MNRDFRIIDNTCLNNIVDLYDQIIPIFIFTKQ